MKLRKWSNAASLTALVVFAAATVIPRQREPVEDGAGRCLAERDCQEPAAFRITRKDRLGERHTYACAAHRERAEYAAGQRFPGWGEPRLTVIALAVTDSEREPDAVSSDPWSS